MISQTKRYCIAGVVAAFVFSADLPANHHEEDKGVSDQDKGTPVDTRSNISPDLGPGLQRLVDIATTDLAARLNVEQETVKVIEAAYVTWRDSSTGCPKPGMQYMQVLTNGARIVLQVGETIYNYHSGGSRPPSYCAEPSPTKPLPYSHGEA